MLRLFLLLALVTVSACSQWEQNVVRGGHGFMKYKSNPSSGIHSGILADDIEVDGYQCRANSWAHFQNDWSLEGCFLAEPLILRHTTIPTGSWVMPRDERLIVVFNEDTPCQGYVCGGTGGAKGTQTVFYLDGKLKAFFPPANTQVGLILCKASPFANIELHQNGRLKRCVAAKDCEVENVLYRRNVTVFLNEDGKPVVSSE